ncbi:MAG TPA: hypothetical protein VFF52_21410, partial [Isosphaeraceae bacterium]|nr:hypothetical protein [Isosphaeraceae bacterium]
IPLFWPLPGQAATPAVATLAAGLAGQGQFGTIKGRLVWGGDEIPPVKVLAEVGKAAKDPNVCARAKPILSREVNVDPKTKGVAFGFAYLTRPKGRNPEAVKQLVAKHPKVVLDQQNCEFQPYVLPIHQDQILLVKSSDPTNHNVRLTPFTNAGVNQNLAPQGQLELKLVAERLPIRVACDIHPWMHAWIMVFDHPFFAVTGPDGTFEIKGVPPGPENLVLWHENVGFVMLPEMGRGRSVTVKAGEVTDVGEIQVDPSRVKSAG